VAEFVVSETRTPCAHCDAWVLRLTDPEHVAAARARIAAGADGVNRDVLAPGNPAWSWHVTSFESFADFAIELCDGWPGFVESDVPVWIANTNGTICFWSYAVSAELAQAPVGPLGSGGGAVALVLLGALVARLRRAPARA
jgi:hypothetical protein